MCWLTQLCTSWLNPNDWVLRISDSPAADTTDIDECTSWLQCTSLALAIRPAVSRLAPVAIIHAAGLTTQAAVLATHALEAEVSLAALGFLVAAALVGSSTAHWLRALSVVAVQPVAAPPARATLLTLKTTVVGTQPSATSAGGRAVVVAVDTITLVASVISGTLHGAATLTGGAAVGAADSLAFNTGGVTEGSGHTAVLLAARLSRVAARLGSVGAILLCARFALQGAAAVHASSTPLVAAAFLAFTATVLNAIVVSFLTPNASLAKQAFSVAAA